MDSTIKPPQHADTLLFLTDAQLSQGIEAMYFAYKGFTADPNAILKQFGYGRAHHRALHFIHSHPHLKVRDLLDILGITKQSLNRVLRQLIKDVLVENKIGTKDRRERLLNLTEKGIALEKSLSAVQRARMRMAYRAAGPDAVLGFRHVLEKIRTASACNSEELKDDT